MWVPDKEIRVGERKVKRGKSNKSENIIKANLKIFFLKFFDCCLLRQKKCVLFKKE